eukprot:TRINITY_DN3025_c2_g1_i6.p1 TRINITY_DN3025_c2_g1~~TRINITY_DN3025_c2_g1_i6.p1  ORF type:complete len:266 (+),score=91.15 TRINITY_DN3025_c2_g1_i6:91-798(+)
MDPTAYPFVPGAGFGGPAMGALPPMPAVDPGMGVPLEEGSFPVLPPPGQDPDTLRNVMVNYIPNAMSETDLRMVFGVYGPIDEVRIIRSRDRSESKGYGFVLFTHSFSAFAAINYLNGYQVYHKRLKVSFAGRDRAEELLRTGEWQRRWQGQQQMFFQYWLASRGRYQEELNSRHGGGPGHGLPPGQAPPPPPQQQRQQQQQQMQPPPQQWWPPQQQAPGFGPGGALGPNIMMHA